VRGGTLIIHGKGEQTRDFVFLDDVVEAMVAAATAPNVDRLVINIGSGKELSITSLVQQVAETAGVSVDWMFIEEHDPGPSRMRADISLAQKTLGYQPRVSLPQGLELILWYPFLNGLQFRHGFRDKIEAPFLCLAHAHRGTPTPREKTSAHRVLRQPLERIDR
jgi:nucleoside-diphosphate-sugar epimerase